MALVEKLRKVDGWLDGLMFGGLINAGAQFKDTMDLIVDYCLKYSYMQGYYKDNRAMLKFIMGSDFKWKLWAEGNEKKVLELVVRTDTSSNETYIYELVEKGNVADTPLAFIRNFEEDAKETYQTMVENAATSVCLRYSQMFGVPVVRRGSNTRTLSMQQTYVKRCRAIFEVASISNIVVKEYTDAEYVRKNMIFSNQFAWNLTNENGCMKVCWTVYEFGGMSMSEKTTYAKDDGDRVSGIFSSLTAINQFEAFFGAGSVVRNAA